MIGNNSLTRKLNHLTLGTFNLITDYYFKNAFESNKVL